MRCEDIKEDLVSFVLGELNEEENEAIKAHIDSCRKCSGEVEQYRQTLLALSRWNIPAHGRPPNFAFLPAPPSKGEDPLPRKRRFRRFAPAIIAALFVAFVTAALYLGTHVRYDGGTISVTIGKVAAAPPRSDSARIAEIIDSVRQQDMQLVSGLVAASEARQMAFYRASFASLSQSLDDRQRSYITYFMDHIYRLQQQDRIAYYQSQAALDGVIRLANAVK